MHLVAVAQQHQKLFEIIRLVVQTDRQTYLISNIRILEASERADGDDFSINGRVTLVELGS